MPIPVKCTCGKKYNVADHLAGTLIYCPNCKLSLDIPAPDHVPTVEEVEILDDEEENVAGATYEVNEPVDDGTSSLAAAASSGFSSVLGQIRSKEASCVAYSAGNKFGLAGIGRDVLVLDVRAHKKLARFEEHDDPVTALACSRNALAALSGDRHGDLILWQIESTHVVRRLRAHRGSVFCCAFSPNGKYAVSGGEDGAVRLWDLATAQNIELLDCVWKDPVTAVAYSHDGSLIAAGTETGRVGLWSVRSGERLYKLRGGREAIESLAFSHDNREFVAVGMSKTSENGAMAWRWLTRDGSPLPAFANPSPGRGALFCLALYPNAMKIVAGSGWVETKTLTGGGTTSQGMATAVVMGGLLGAAIYSTMANSSGSQTDHLCGLQTFTVDGGVRGIPISGVKRAVMEVAISPDGSRALGALEGGDLAVFALPL